MKAYKAKRRSKSGPRTYSGKPVLDAKQSFLLDVTRRDCERGADGDPGHCAAAVAALRQFPHAKNVWVGRSTTIVELVDHCIRFATPHALRDQEVARGKQHSPPDRPRGDPNSPKKRTMRELGGRLFGTPNEDTMAEARRMLTLKQVLRIVPLGRSTLQRMEADGRFPRGRMLAGNRKAWFEDEVARWQEDRADRKKPA